MATRLRKVLVGEARAGKEAWRGQRLVRRLTFAYGAVAALLCSFYLCTSVALADVTVSPTAPPGSVALQDLVDWGGYTGAAACLGGAIYGFGKMGLSHKDGNYGASNHGRTVAMMSLAGALGLGVAPTVINTLTAIH